MGGCLATKSSTGSAPNDLKKQVSYKSINTPQVNKGRKQQGMKELKQNYNINKNSEEIGHGAFGSVFKTFSVHNPDHIVAIKVMSKQKLESNLDYIAQEVAIMNDLDHPNVVKYFESYDDYKYIYLVMEYITGQQLFTKITETKNQTFGEQQAAKYMKQLFKAIAHCHASNVVHRDIKPENIMITDDDEVKLIDFGLSKIKKQTKQMMHTVAGTPFYMAPEVLNENYGTKADIWSLGVLLYVLVSGYLPF